MKIIKHLSAFGAAILMMASMGSVYAEENDASHTRTQDRVRTELNLQTATSDIGQSQNREQHTVENQYRYKHDFQNNGAGSGKDLMKTKNTENNIWHGYDNGSSMDRMNATNRYMQGSFTEGSMNRQNTANRSMSGRR